MAQLIVMSSNIKYSMIQGPVYRIEDSVPSNCRNCYYHKTSGQKPLNI